MTLEQQELLIVLAEECGEAVHAAAKTARHGLWSRHPIDPADTNQQWLEKEVGHVLAIMERLSDIGVLDMRRVQQHRETKKGTMGRWLHRIGNTEEIPWT